MYSKIHPKNLMNFHYQSCIRGNNSLLKEGDGARDFNYISFWLDTSFFLYYFLVFFWAFSFYLIVWGLYLSYTFHLNLRREQSILYQFFSLHDSRFLKVFAPAYFQVYKMYIIGSENTLLPIWQWLLSSCCISELQDKKSPN